jgi:hypothetical protein
VFTPEERSRVRERVFEVAQADPRAGGGAVTGSATIDAEDAWSDVDTSFGIADGADPREVLDDWTAELDRELDFVHYWDLVAGPTIYRVYLLASSLELDIAVTPASEVGQRGPKFRLVFGESGEPQEPVSPRVEETIGMGWLSALVVSMAIARNRPWQALLFVNLLRDQALGLACIRHGEPPEYARGTDKLPRDVTEPYEGTIPGSLELDEFRRAAAAATTGLLREVEHVKPDLAARLAGVLA